MIKINIGGDFCIMPPYISNSFFENDIIDLFEQSDINIINLECPVTGSDTKHKIIKTGPHLKTDERIFEHFSLLNTHILTLANNHILDYGEKGLKNTLDYCTKHSIQYVGAGINSNEASEYLILEKEKRKIAFVNICENEWSTATQNSAGSNPLNIIDNLSQIRSAKQHADFVIVIVHGGQEYYHLPSPHRKKLYHFLAENGANAVIGHHTHCFSGYEIHKSVPIAYGLGNMLFTMNSKNEVWYTGLIARLNIEKNKPIQLKLVPIRQSKQTFKLSLLKDTEKEDVLRQINYLNSIINNPFELDNKWESFILSNTKIINLLSPVSALPGKYIRAIFNRLGLSEQILSRRYLISILNHIRCESHQEVITELLKLKILKK